MHNTEKEREERKLTIKPSVEMETKEYYQSLHQQIENQENLMSQRVIWLVLSQSFLFSAFAVNNNAPKEPRTPLLIETFSALLWLIPTIGLTVSIFVYISILISIFTTSNIRNLFYANVNMKEIDILPPVQAEGINRILGFSGPFVLPIVFISTWVYLLVVIFTA